MRSLKSVFLNELILVFRNKFLILPFVMNIICWGIIIFTYEIAQFHFIPRGTLFYNSFQWVLLLNLLLVGLFATYIGSKDRESEFELLVVTYQISSSRWLLGKWFVAQCYGACFTFITLLIQTIWFVGGGMDFTELYQNIIYVFIQMSGSIFLILSIGYLSGVFTKNIISYLLTPLILGWMAYLQLEITTNSFINPKLKQLLGYDAFYIDSAYEDIWGIHRAFESAILHQVIVFLVGFLILFVTLLIYRPRRSKRSERVILVTLLVFICISTVVLSERQYAQYDSAYNQYIETGKFYALPIEEEESFYEHRWNQIKSDITIDQMELTIAFPEQDIVAMKSELTLRNQSDAPVNEFFITLHHQLEITECMSELVDVCTRENDLLTVKTVKMIEPDQEIYLTLNYTGSIRQYRHDALIDQSFSNKDGIYLPKEAGWYPLIGKRNLAISRSHNNINSNFELRNERYKEENSTMFSVQIVESPDIPIVLTIPKMDTGIYKGSSQYGLSLLGGKLQEVEAHGIRIISHPDVQQSAVEAVNLQIDGWKSIERWLEVPVLPKVIYVMDPRHKMLMSETLNREFAVWDEYTLKDIHTRDWLRAYYTASSLVTDEPITTSDDIVIVKRLMTWELQKHFKGQSQIGRFAETYYESYQLVSPEVVDVITIIDNYEKQGDATFSNIVKYLFLHYERMENKENFNLVEALKGYEEEGAR